MYQNILRAAVASLLLSAPSVIDAQTPALTACTVRGLEGDVRCGTVRVPENPALPRGRQLELRVVVAGATGSDRAPDPLLLLSGGPGQAGTEMGPFASEAFGRARVRRDIVLMDMRGTGASGSLACTMMTTSEDLVGWTLFPPKSVRSCRAELSSRADLTQYTTARAADDIEAVRRAFGWPALNIYGTSYGSRLALAYLRRHPRRVRAMVLKAVAPPTLVAPMNYAEDGERAFALLVRDCRADSACARLFPSPRADLDSVLRRAEAGRVAAVIASENGRVDTLALTRDAIAGAVLGAMQSMGTRARLPLLLRRAARGETQPLADLIVRYRRQIDAGLAAGLHLSVGCADDGHRLDLRAARRTNGRTFLGDSRVRMLAEACGIWPRMPRDRAMEAAARGSAPVLLVSGELDPNTPPRWAEEAGRTLPHARHVLLRGVAHGWSNVERCGAELVADFLERASARDLNLSCAGRSSAPPFATSLPSR